MKSKFWPRGFHISLDDFLQEMECDISYIFYMKYFDSVAY